MHTYTKFASLTTVLLSLLLAAQSVSISAQGNQPTPTKVLIQIVASKVEIHSGPGESYPVIGTVAAPGKIALSGISADGKWFMFKYAGAQGWISSASQSSKFISGAKEDITVADYQEAQATYTPTATAQLKRGTLPRLVSNDYCALSVDAGIAFNLAGSRLSGTSGFDYLVSVDHRFRKER